MGEAFYGKVYREAPAGEMQYVGLPSFLKLPYVRTRDDLQKLRPDAAIIGEPFDHACVTKPGTRYGPRAIRAASIGFAPPVEHFNIETGIDPFELFRAVDYGDVPVTPDVVESHNSMTNKVLEALEAGATPIVLGGDHSVTFPNVRAMFKKFKGKIGVIHLDAHADCSAGGLSGYRYDHGTHIRRIYDLGCLAGKNYTLIAARAYWPGPDLYGWMRDMGFQWFTSMDIEEQGPEAIAKWAAERASDGTEAVWISWDIDSFDPAYAPGTGAPEAGGMTSREGIKIARLLARSFDVDRFGMDMVEVSPPLDTSEHGYYSGGITSVLAFRVVLEILAGLAVKKQNLKGGLPIRPLDYKGKGNTGYEIG